MKKISIIKKIVLILLTALIIAGIVTFFVAGFKQSNEYVAGTRLEIYIPQGYEKTDIINIADESFNEEVSFVEIEKLNQVAGVKIKSYTEEELKNFKTSISEKYGIEEEKLELHEVSLPVTKVETVVAPYVFPALLVTVLSLIYILFRNLKAEDKWKKVLKALLVLVIVLGTYFSLILVTRAPFGTYTMPVALLIYITTLLMIAKKHE